MAAKQQIALRFSSEEMETINQMRREHQDPPTQPAMVMAIVRGAIAEYRKTKKKKTAA